MADETLPPELAVLALPEIVEELSFDDLRAAFIGELQAAFDAAGIAYEVSTLEANPGVMLSEAAAYRETLLRQRINEAARDNLLPFARTDALDNLAAFYDVSRLAGESDAALRYRIVTAIQGRSTGGTAARYKSIALGADVRVADVAVYTEGRDPTVRVAVFSTDNGGAADAALVAKVDAALQADSVRMVNDTIEVASAAQQVVDVTANIWLLPTASASAVADAEDSLRAAWASEMTLGRDVSLSWIYARLQVPGVHHAVIAAPASDIEIAFNKAAAIGSVTLTNMGRVN